MQKQKKRKIEGSFSARFKGDFFVIKCDLIHAFSVIVNLLL